jgi:hypothetical protein
MRAIRQSGSEGGVALIRHSYPYRQIDSREEQKRSHGWQHLTPTL